ncbi:hypothetical protein GQ43DRAFT_436210 [Delitschia confertaspora ATCC 74209]|uniref:Uncharacterized protein n=1 Tax=Delitschia confertaspora ATCC 74209 TaxID=1513339 RepID=A0A9P4JE76_9PLEO|nr:hypothetical protein GQ43DRAFT_436210 [Delitschia confertaspora ATCC 74209]
MSGRPPLQHCTWNIFRNIFRGVELFFVGFCDRARSGRPVLTVSSQIEYLGFLSFTLYICLLDVAFFVTMVWYTVRRFDLYELLYCIPYAVLTMLLWDQYLELSGGSALYHGFFRLAMLHSTRCTFAWKSLGNLFYRGHAVLATIWLVLRIWESLLALSELAYGVYLGNQAESRPSLSPEFQRESVSTKADPDNAASHHSDCLNSTLPGMESLPASVWQVDGHCGSKSADSTWNIHQWQDLKRRHRRSQTDQTVDSKTTGDDEGEDPTRPITLKTVSPRLTLAEEAMLAKRLSNQFGAHNPSFLPRRHHSIGFQEPQRVPRQLSLPRRSSDIPCAVGPASPSSQRKSGTPITVQAAISRQRAADSNVTLPDKMDGHGHTSDDHTSPGSSSIFYTPRSLSAQSLAGSIKEGGD